MVEELTEEKAIKRGLVVIQEAAACDKFKEKVAQATTKNTWVGQMAPVGSNTWVGVKAEYETSSKGAHWLYYSNGKPQGMWISDANYRNESWACCEIIQGPLPVPPQPIVDLICPLLE